MGEICQSNFENKVIMQPFKSYRWDFKTNGKDKKYFKNCLVYKKNQEENVILYAKDCHLCYGVCLSRVQNCHIISLFY